MNKLSIECRAKINLAIDVIGKRENGYHDVLMIMQEVPLADRLTLRLRNDGKIILTCDKPGLPLNEDNLAYRAAKVFFELLGIFDGVDIAIEKRIPMGAGMGGGSADAAGVLKGLNALYGKPFELDKLMKLGAKLGADVPFCVMGGCALAEGIGEILTPLPMPPVLKYVIAKPEPSVSTRWVYENLDISKRPINLDVLAVADGIRNGDIATICKNSANILETVTIPQYPVIGWIKETFKESGAILSLMSGSGSAVFGIFRSDDEVEKGVEAVKQFTDEIYVM